ncbi:hypothetical protein [Taklimakanibacter albus]|uniref:Uncharacterized protein n=1 Tax=Taklimakanibacter albus TaxID=2800327 RepID=A0ACC5RBW2_9HYPH|nr:hypothetical protein [Aestuariivirga sp. YIM B02566]MBK1869965.1 hypothetical protein [Aestuariivirga sp. YIM B02566]
MDAMRTRLAEVLAAYGADPARWPASERDRLQPLLDKEPGLLAEASEIDRVLAKAVPPAPSAQGKAQLLARITQEKQKVNVVPFERARAKPRPSIWSWGTAAALAASFAFGIFLGGNTNFGNFRSDSDVVEIDDPIVLTGIDDAPDLLEGGG